MNIHGYSILLVVGNILIAATAAWHALLFKRDPKSSLGWIAVIIIFPLVGPLLYFLFGINRIKTRAQKLTGKSPFRIFGYDQAENDVISSIPRKNIPEKYSVLENISDTVTRRPLVGNNKLIILHNGETAYPAMFHQGSQRVCC